MPRESSKCRQWEKERRNRLKEAFNGLVRVLPCYDPSVTIGQINILQKATVTIQELQEEVKKIVSPATENNTARDRLIKKLHDRIKKLLMRNEQLNNLLRDAGISVPKHVGIVKKFKRPRPWINRISPDQAKVLSKCEMEKENISNKPSPSRKRKTKLITCVAPKHRTLDLRKSEKTLVRKRKHGKKSSLTNCLFLLSHPITVKTTIHQPCYLITKPRTSAAKVGTNKTSVAQPTFPCVNPIIPSLSPGTLILKNGTVIPVVSQPVIFPAPTAAAIVANPLPAIKIQNITESKEVPKIQKSILTGLGRLPVLRPNYCLTTTTQVNKVPIPALTSKYANNRLLLKTKVLEGQPVRSTNKMPRTKIQKQKTVTNKIRTVNDTATKKTNLETKTDSVNESISESSSIETNGVVKTADVQKIIEEPTPPNEHVAESSHSKDLGNGTTVTNATTEMIHNKEPCSDTDVLGNVDKNSELQNKSLEESNTPVEKLPSNDSPLLGQCHGLTAPTIVTTTTTPTSQEEIKSLELNIPHSELSNDIFASLQDGPGCQNPESTSPTAAFLMAFPLVSSMKANEVMYDDNSQSQRGTPNLLQIGTIDTTKTTHSEGNLMSLDHFPFFSSKDSCGNYYSSYASLVSKCSEALNSTMDPPNPDYVNAKSSSSTDCGKVSGKTHAVHMAQTSKNIDQSSAYGNTMNVSHDVMDENAKTYSDIDYSGQQEKPVVKIEPDNIHFDIFHDKTVSAIFKNKQFDCKEDDVNYNIFTEKPLNPSLVASNVSKSNELANNVTYIDSQSHCSNIALNVFQQMPFTFSKDSADALHSENEDNLENTNRNIEINISKKNKNAAESINTTDDAVLKNECRSVQANITTNMSLKNERTNVGSKGAKNANNQTSISSSNSKLNIPSNTDVAHGSIPSTSAISSSNTKAENRSASTANGVNDNICNHMLTKNMDKLIVNNLNTENCINLRHETDKVQTTLNSRKDDSTFSEASFKNEQTSIPRQNMSTNTSRNHTNSMKIPNENTKVDHKDSNFKRPEQNHYNINSSSSKEKAQQHNLQNLNLPVNEHFNLSQQSTCKTVGETNNMKLDHIPYNIFELNTEHSSNILGVQTQIPNNNINAARHQPYNIFEHMSNPNSKNVSNVENKQENLCLNIKLPEHIPYNLFDKTMYPIQELEPSFHNQNQRNISYNTFQQNAPKGVQNLPNNSKGNSEVSESYNYNNIFNNKFMTSSNQSQLNRKSEQFMDNINFNIFPDMAPKGIVPIQRSVQQQNDNVKIPDIFHDKNTTNSSKVDNSTNMDMIHNVQYNPSHLSKAGVANHNSCENHINLNFNYTLYPAKNKDNTPQMIGNCENHSNMSIHYNIPQKNEAIPSHVYQEKKSSKKLDPPIVSENAPYLFPGKTSNNLKDSKICKVHEQNLTHFNLFNERHNLAKEIAMNTCDKPIVKNVVYNVFQDKPKEENIIKMSEIVPPQQNKDPDQCQKDLEQRSQCYFATTYPNTPSNFNYKSDAPKMCPTCSYMNLNKNYSNPLYTSCSNYNYNYHPDPIVSQNYYKPNIPKNDGKSYYPFNYENYPDYRKNDSTYASNKAYSNNSNFPKDKKNAGKTKNLAQNKPVNWMTTPENKPPAAECLVPPFSAQSYSFTGSETADLNSIMETKKPMEVPLLPDDKQFSWSPTKLPNFLDPAQNIVTPTLPTLVGDLALSNHLPFTDQKCPSKEVKRKHGTCESQSNFLSVSQLVEHGKNESTPARTTARRNSGNRAKNSAYGKNRRLSKSDPVAEEKANQIKPANNCNVNSNELFYEPKNTRSANKNTSSYSAEALIGNQGTPVAPRKANVPSSKALGSSSFLTENIITYFPTVEENYMPQPHNFQSGSFPHNTFQNNTFSTNSFIHSAPTITSTYLSNTFDSTSHEYPLESANLVANVKDTKASINKNFKPTAKDDKNVTYTPKKAKKKLSNDIGGGLASLEFPFLPVSGTTNSPILPDEFHPHTSFLAPPNSYPCKNSLYTTKQSNEFNANSLLPLPALPRNTIPHSEVSPSINPAGTSLTNFNLSTIFPEINKVEFHYG